MQKNGGFCWVSWRQPNLQIFSVIPAQAGIQNHQLISINKLGRPPKKKRFLAPIAPRYPQ
jgi:hypothetical protein